MTYSNIVDGYIWPTDMISDNDIYAAIDISLVLSWCVNALAISHISGGIWVVNKNPVPDAEINRNIS